MPKEKAVLAYSGGLDTSIILKWMVEKGYDVITFTADLGQKEDVSLNQIKQKAINTGASVAVVEDVKREFVEDFIFPAIRANAKYEGRYLLGTSLARPLTAKKQVEVAKRFGATVLSHGSTGKGNDQVRFELAYRTLYPECEIYAPWKDPEFLAKFKGRDDLIEYAQKNNIPISQTKKEPWSSDANFMHISFEAGELEDPALSSRASMFQMTKSPQDAPDKETKLRISFEKGNPIGVENLDAGGAFNSPVSLFTYLNQVAGENGVGRVDMVENRYVGMKSRGVYETPAGTVLHEAHRDLEGITMDREVMRIRDSLIPLFAERIYSGYWFSPEMELLRNIMDSTQEFVSGTVDLALYKGNVTIISRYSPYSLYDAGIASMHEAGKYDPTKARGFIDINALRLRAWAKRAKIIKSFQEL